MLAALTGLRCRHARVQMVDAPTKHGRQEFWEQSYQEGERFSWYSGWAELEPFFAELVPDRNARVLVPGVGNDAAMVDLYDAGWQQLTLFDYAPSGVERAAALFGDREVDLRVADACALPYADGSFDAVLDKGTLDAVYLSGGTTPAARLAKLTAAADELARLLRPGGVVLSLTAVAAPKMPRCFHERDGADPLWRVLRDGEATWITEDGFASNNVDAPMLAWERLARDISRK